MRDVASASPPAPVLGTPGVPPDDPVVLPDKVTTGAVIGMLPWMGELAPTAATIGTTAPFAPLALMAEGLTLSVTLLPADAAAETLQTSAKRALVPCSTDAAGLKVKVAPEAPSVTPGPVCE